MIVPYLEIKSTTIELQAWLPKNYTTFAIFLIAYILYAHTDIG